MSDRGGGADRGQTGIDFLVAMAVFLLTVGFVVGFLPGMLAPFGADQEHPTVASRSADVLAGSLLAGTAGPGALNATCTVAFFGASSDAGCPFDAGEPVTDRVGVGSRYRLNVTLVADADGTVLCADGDRVGACGTPLAAGPPVPADGATTVVRVVGVDGTDAVLVVSVW